MSALIETFEKEYALITSDISGKIGKIPNLSGGEKKSIVNQAEQQINEAQELLEQMDLEVKGLQPSIRPKYLTRLSSYQAELSRLKKDLHQSAIAFSDTAREDLFGDEELSARAEEQRALLLDNTERLERTSRKLTSGYKIAVETESVGAEILTNLHDQRQSIRKTRDRLRNADEDLGKSSRLLTGMMRRLLQNKLMLYGIGLLMLIVVILAIYFTVRKHS